MGIFAKKLFAVGILYILFISVYMPYAASGQDANISLDIKTTRLSVTLNKENGLVDAGQIVGTITNYGGENISDIRIEIEIESDGSMPVEAEGGGGYIELFPTKAIYHISSLAPGNTKDFGVSIGISDKSISEVRYGIDVYIPKENETGLKRIYTSTDLLLPVDINIEDKCANWNGQFYDPCDNGEVSGFIERNLTYIVLGLAIIAIIALAVAIFRR